MVEFTDAGEGSIRQTQGPVRKARAQPRVMSPIFEYASQPMIQSQVQAPEVQDRASSGVGLFRKPVLRKPPRRRRRWCRYVRRLAWEALACTTLAYVVLVVIAEPRCRNVFCSVLDRLPGSFAPGLGEPVNPDYNSVRYQEWYADVEHAQMNDPFGTRINEATVSPSIFRSLRSVSTSIDDLSHKLPSTDLPLRLEIVGALANCETAINSTIRYIWNFENHMGDMADEIVKAAESTEVGYNRLNELKSQSQLHRDNWILSNILVPYLTYRPPCARLQRRQTQLLSGLVQDIARRLPPLWREGVATCDSLATLTVAFDNVQTLVRRDGKDTEDQQERGILEGANSWYYYSPGRFYNKYLVKKQLKKLKVVQGIVRDTSKQTDVQMERLGRIAREVTALENLFRETQKSDGAENNTCSEITSTGDPPELKQLNEIISMIKRVAEDKGRSQEY